MLRKVYGDVHFAGSLIITKSHSRKQLGKKIKMANCHTSNPCSFATLDNNFCYTRMYPPHKEGITQKLLNAYF
jgi:Zn-finger protein